VSPEGVVDPGLQCERTSLAWRRTAFSFCVVGALLLHTADGAGHWLSLTISVPTLTFSVWAYRLSHARYRRAVASIRTDRPVAAAGDIRVVAVATTVLQMFAIAMCLNALLTPWPAFISR
jgi:uncharacterized membrane protein YidH (DUF202 family)